MNDDNHKIADNTQKDPDKWKTGNERATGAQISYIKTMSEEVEENIDTKNLSKAEAAKAIENLQRKTGRGQRKSN